MSPVVPITLILVLLVGALVFMVLSSRSGRSDFDASRQPSHSRRARPNHGTRRSDSLLDREDSELAPPDGLVPGFGPAASTAAPDEATSAWGGDVTRVPTGGPDGPPDGLEPVTSRSPLSDPDRTGWTEPPIDPPPTFSTSGQDDATMIVTTPPRPPSEDFGRSSRPSRPSPPPTAQAWDDDALAGSPESAGGLVAQEPVVTTAPALRLAAAGRTRRGKRGGPNEDAFVVADGLLAVADGVGGEAAGQIASTLAVTTVAQFRPQYAADPREGLRQAVARANTVVREKPAEQPSWLGMACTLDVVVLGRQRETGERLTVAHVGDSSVWLQPDRGRPRKLTTPHAMHNGPLLNAVGLGDEIDADLIEEPVKAGDRVVLASDGITKVLSPEQLDGLLTELGKEPPERAADALVEAAALAGARDDTTIVVADLVPDPTSR